MTSLVKRLVLITCCWLTGLPQTQALAGVVYSWVDPHGVTHFSETPPPDPAIQPAMIELRPLPPPLADDDDYYSVVRQAERMERNRLENEKLEAERRQAEAEAIRARIEAQAALQTPDTHVDPAFGYLPVYPGYPGYGPGHGNRTWLPGQYPNRPGYWPGQPGRPQPGHGSRPPGRRVISAIPARP
jgi:Domain of unknown function (DUF4124)